MIRDMIVVDAMVHPYDLAPENQNPAAAQLQAVYAAHPDELMALEGVRSVEVCQTLDDLWTPDRVGRSP